MQGLLDQPVDQWLAEHKKVPEAEAPKGKKVKSAAKSKGGKAGGKKASK